jgi:integrating conjugative element protein (TIGR03759 family)
MTSRGKAFMVSMVLMASPSLPSVMATELSQTQVKETGKDAVSTAANALSATDLARARLWELSETEWQRYQQLMQGIRGSISPATLSPIEVLGIHARDEAERERYAEAWARALHEDADRILAFQRAYDAATKRLYPHEPLIDIERLSAKAEQAEQAAKAEETRVLQATDRLLFFTRPDCPACDALMKQLVKRIDDVSGIDIYLMDVEPGDDAAVRTWASAHRIKPEWVRGRQITLNHDGGALAKLTQGHGDVPAVLRRRGEALSPLRPSDL